MEAHQRHIQQQAAAADHDKGTADTDVGPELAVSLCTTRHQAQACPQVTDTVSFKTKINLGNFEEVVLELVTCVLLIPGTQHAYCNIQVAWKRLQHGGCSHQTSDVV